MKTNRRALRTVAAFSLLLALGGCVIVPGYGPYYHPFYHHYW